MKSSILKSKNSNSFNNKSSNEPQITTKSVINTISNDSNNKYVILRSKLDKLNIYHSFDIVNYQLVDNLVDIVNKYKEEHMLKDRKIENFTKDLENKAVLLQSALSENQLLIADNNELHNQIVKFERGDVKHISPV